MIVHATECNALVYVGSRLFIVDDDVLSSLLPVEVVLVQFDVSLLVV